MSTIRRQSIISSGIVYSGFALGFLNIYLLIKGVTPAQYGLTTIFMTLASIMLSFANLGMQNYVYKFYPYYKDNLSPKQNDMMTWALLISVAGFVLTMTGGIIFKGLVIEKFSTNAPDLVKYYYWVFVFGLGFTLYNVLEVYAWHLKKSVLTSYLKEIQFRIFITILIVLYSWGIIKDFDLFIKIFSFTYLLLALVLFVNLLMSGNLHFTLRRSRVTKRFFKKILMQASLVWSGMMLFTVSSFFGSLVIASVIPNGLDYAGVYNLALNIGSVVQAPQRSIIAASVGPLSRAWKDKDHAKIGRIYQRSSINLLIFALALFLLIWINFTDGVLTFHMNPLYLQARPVFFFIGLWRIVDMGTGVNAQILSTSTFWRFDFFTGLTLAAVTLPLNYWLTKAIGVSGPAIADLISFSIYNAIRWLFLYRKFNMQPFTRQTLYTLLLGIVDYFICNGLFGEKHGFLWIVVRSLTFIAIYGAGVLGLHLSEDVLPVWRTFLKKLGLAPR